MHAVALVGRDGDDAQLRMPAQQHVAERRPAPRLLLGDKKKIGMGAFNQLGNFEFVGGFTDHFDIRLVGKCGEDKLTKKPRAVGDEDANGALRGAGHERRL